MSPSLAKEASKDSCPIKFRKDGNKCVPCSTGNFFNFHIVYIIFLSYAILIFANLPTDYHLF